MKASALLGKMLSFLIFLSMANAGQLYSYQERIIICMVSIDYADAEQLVDVLAPFLSPQGKIAAYTPTNTLVIKDQASVVKMLLKVIKGKEDLSECTNLRNGREGSNKIP